MRVYTITTGALPNPITHPIQARKVRDFMTKLDGLISVSPLIGHTILGFITLNDAKIARNLLLAEGNQVGTYVMRGELDKEKNDLFIVEPAEEVSPEDRAKVEKEIRWSGRK